ncbi:NAD(P)-dependent oxidoreductase [Acidobacteria bacterium AH-259-G07]|nr:NAD(P)-dependent oxidoreductase [Acidobacteria bacterium AH-259-G07]
MSNSSLHILITGGAGYIGSILTRVLLEQGFSVTVLDNFMYEQNSLLDCFQFENFRVIRGDCRDENLIRQLVKKADIVIPLAALVGARVCERNRVGAQSTNLDAIRLLCTQLSPSQRLLFPVTNSGYGIGEKDKCCTEDTPLRPISLYGVTKVEAEKVVLERENSISFRLATVFGLSPRMRLDLLVNNFVWHAVTDRAVVVFEGHFKRNFIHIRDTVKVFLHGIYQFELMKSRPYNVGLEDANLSKLELCHAIQKVIPSFVFFESPIGEDVDKRNYIVSNARILQTGFKPEWSLERGIKELLRGYVILQNRFYSNI